MNSLLASGLSPFALFSVYWENRKTIATSEQRLAPFVQRCSELFGEDRKTIARSE